MSRLSAPDGLLGRLIAEGATLDQLVRLELHAAVNGLSRPVAPLGELAGRQPLSRRRPQFGAPS